MCGRYVLKQNLAEICRLFGVQTALTALSPHYNAGPGTKRPVIIKDRLGEALWNWPAGDDMKPVINIRSETAAQKAMFARDWDMNRRCIIPASGFYEWDASGQPFYVEAQDAEMIGFCGLWTRDENMDAHFAILTRAALPHLAPVHPRMPVTIVPEQAKGWIERAQMPAPPVLDIFPVGKAVNLVANNAPALLDAMAAAPQGNLFAAQ